MALTTKQVTDFLGDSASKLTPEAIKALGELVQERNEIDPDAAGRLSGNTKRIQALIGKSLMAAGASQTEAEKASRIVFTKTSTGAAKAPASEEAIKRLEAERGKVPHWEPGRKAALTREIKRMRKELDKAKADKAATDKKA